MRKLKAISLIALSIVFSLPAIIAGAGVAAAQSSDGCPDGPNCIAAYTFDSGLEGWTTDAVSSVWMENKSLGVQLALGVLHIYDINPQTGILNPTNRDSLFHPGIYKQIYLQPGRYQIRVNAGQDATLILNNIYLQVQTASTMVQKSSELSAWYYTVVSSNIIQISQPQTVRIQVATSANSYFDWIYIEQLADTYPTATPLGGVTITPGGPTLTPTLTPIPLNQQATPMPPATAVCQSGEPEPTSAIPDYSATPVTGTLSILETFRQYTVDLSSSWSKLGQVLPWSGGDHTEDGGVSVRINYDPHWNQTSLSDFTNALIVEANFGEPVWVNAWAQADVVPVGGTAKMEVWELSGGVWTIVTGTFSIASQNWYPIHAAISSNAERIAFVPVRSDTPSSGYALVDDVYIYAPESNKPYCSGQYPTGTTSFDGGAIFGTDYSTTLFYPADKPCPGGIMQPNNMWGMILTQLTIFLDAQMASAPAHVLGTTRDLVRQFILSPVGGLIVLAQIVLDWNIPVIMLEIYIAFQAGLGVVGIWKLIRRTFII